MKFLRTYKENANMRKAQNKNRSNAIQKRTFTWFQAVQEYFSTCAIRVEFGLWGGTYVLNSYIKFKI